jgi:hypothetical protein
MSNSGKPVSHGTTGSGPERRAKVTTLADGLRKLADTLEANQALYEPIAFEREATALVQRFREFLQIESKLHRVPEKLFLQCRAAWLRGWQLHPGEMRTRCEEILGRLPHHLADETELSWRLHVLVEVLETIPDADRVLAVCQPRTHSDETPSSTSHVEDQGATDALLLWGQMTLEEFLLAWAKLDPELVKRCATLVGVTITRPTLAAKRKLHSLAVRLFRNTRM